MCCLGHNPGTLTVLRDRTTAQLLIPCTLHHFSFKLIWYKENIPLLLLSQLLFVKIINWKCKMSWLWWRKTTKAVTWTTDIKLRAVRRKAVVSLDPAARSLSRPLNRQDFWLGRPLPWTTEITFNLNVSASVSCLQEQIFKCQSQRFSSVVKWKLMRMTACKHALETQGNLVLSHVNQRKRILNLLYS